jgi:hemolysin activation/secretion protein
MRTMIAVHTPVLALALTVLCLIAPPARAAEAGVVHFSVGRFVIEGDNPLGPGESEAVLAPYRGQHSGLAVLETAAGALESAIRARGYAFHRVILPPQTLGGDVLTLKVLRFRLGTINVTGNQHFSRDNVLRSLPELKSAATPNTQLLARSLAIGSEHPFKRTALTMREGGEPDTIDAEVRVQDANPQQLFAAVSNTGRRETGWYRATIGYQHGNVFDRDHSVSLSYTTSPTQSSDVQQYGLNYWIPFYGVGGSLAAYYVYSDVESGRVADFFQVSGRGEFYGARYTHAFPRRDTYQHKLAAAFDSRYFKNDVSFVGIPIGSNIGSRPLSLRYSGSVDFVRGSAGFYGEYAHNVSGGSDNDNVAYSAARAGADRDWWAMRYGADLNYSLGNGWNGVARLRGQFTNEALIPGEQFGIGGANSVRGFLEREAAGDTGYFVNFELWSPQVAQSLRVLAFIDAARRKYDVPIPGQVDVLNIASVGAGLRWRWQRSLDFSADAAYVLDGIPGNMESADVRIHVNLILRF